MQRAAIGDELGGECVATARLGVAAVATRVAVDRVHEPVGGEERRVLERPQPVVGELVPEHDAQLVSIEQREDAAAQHDDQLVGHEHQGGVRLASSLGVVHRQREREAERGGGVRRGGEHVRVGVGLQPVGRPQERRPKPVEVVDLGLGRGEHRPDLRLLPLQVADDLALVRQRGQLLHGRDVHPPETTGAPRRGSGGQRTRADRSRSFARRPASYPRPWSVRGVPWLQPTAGPMLVPWMSGVSST